MFRERTNSADLGSNAAIAFGHMVVAVTTEL